MVVLGQAHLGGHKRLRRTARIAAVVVHLIQPPALPKPHPDTRSHLVAPGHTDARVALPQITAAPKIKQRPIVGVQEGVVESGKLPRLGVLNRPLRIDGAGVVALWRGQQIGHLHTASAPRGWTYHPRTRSRVTSRTGSSRSVLDFLSSRRSTSTSVVAVAMLLASLIVAPRWVGKATLSAWVRFTCPSRAAGVESLVGRGAQTTSKKSRTRANGLAPRRTPLPHAGGTVDASDPYEAMMPLLSWLAAASLVRGQQMHPHDPTRYHALLRMLYRQRIDTVGTKHKHGSRFCLHGVRGVSRSA